MKEEYLINELGIKLLEACRICNKEYNYPPNIFIELLNEHGPKLASEMVICQKFDPSGFTKLIDKENGLKYSVEYVILTGEWKTLFDKKTLSIARQRLDSVNQPYPEWFPKDEV